MEIYKRNICGKGRSLINPEIDMAENYPLKLPRWMKEQLREKYGRSAPGLIKSLLMKHAGLKRPETK